MIKGGIIDKSTINTADSSRYANPYISFSVTNHSVKSITGQAISFGKLTLGLCLQAKGKKEKN